MLTKKIITVLWIIMLIAIPGSCKDNNKDTIQSEKKSKIKYKVTFIELGSVRCIPCKAMQPIMEEIKNEYANIVKVVFHDVWTPEGQPYAKEYQIQAIPTQIFLDENGIEYYRHQGFFPKEELVKILEIKI